MKTKAYNRHDFFLSRKNIFEICENAIRSTNDTSIFIPHICGMNDNPSKISRLIYDRYPIVKQNIDVSVNHKIGQNQYVSVLHNKNKQSNIFVANMFCRNQKNKNRHVNYYALATCMINLQNHCKNYKLANSDQKIEIHSPKIGTGIDGGDWNTIANLIDDIWANYFTVFIYEPNNV